MNRSILSPEPFIQANVIGTFTPHEHEAARIAIETSEYLDQQLEAYPLLLLKETYNYNKRCVIRALHRNEHLDEVDAALKK